MVVNVTSRKEFSYKETFIPFPREIDANPSAIHLHEVTVDCDLGSEDEPFMWIVGWYENEEREREQAMIFFGSGLDGLDRARRFGQALIEIADRLEEYEG